eukprot:4529118-Amphidinium_carterae.1
MSMARYLIHRKDTSQLATRSYQLVRMTFAPIGSGVDSAFLLFLQECYRAAITWEVKELTFVCFANIVASSDGKWESLVVAAVVVGSEERVIVELLGLSGTACVDLHHGAL